MSRQVYGGAPAASRILLLVQRGQCCGEKHRKYMSTRQPHEAPDNTPVHQCVVHPFAELWAPGVNAHATSCAGSDRCGDKRAARCLGSYSGWPALVILIKRSDVASGWMEE